ncbi:MAG TPA: hypothetical protein VGL23_20575 [Chloroflexota bacterium]|jgi:hypothetical protein
MPPPIRSARLLGLVAAHERDGLADLEQLALATDLDAFELELELRALVDEGYLLRAREPGHHDSACLTTAGLRLLRGRDEDPLPSRR